MKGIYNAFVLCKSKKKTPVFVCYDTYPAGGILTDHVMSPEKGIAAWSFFDSKDELSKESQVFDFIGDIYDKVSPSVVGVSSLGGDGDPAVIGSGSGLIVSQEGLYRNELSCDCRRFNLADHAVDGRSTSGTRGGQRA